MRDDDLLAVTGAADPSLSLSLYTYAILSTPRHLRAMHYASNTVCVTRNHSATKHHENPCGMTRLNP